MKNLLLNRNMQLKPATFFFPRRILTMMNQFLAEREREMKRSNLPGIDRQQVKQLGHQTRLNTIYQKKKKKTTMTRKSATAICKENDMLLNLQARIYNN